MRRVLFATALVLAGCGGSTAPNYFDPSHADAGTPDSGRQPPEAGTGSIEGSFDLAFTNATLTSNAPFSTGIPSIGAKARVDIRKTDSGYDAMVTPRWGDPSAFSVSVAAGAVTLTGTTKIDGTGGTTDSWSQIVLARSASGGLSGAITAVGREDVFEGDVGWSGDLSGTGTIGVDATPPETRGPNGSTGPSGALLPWDSIVLDAAEPVDLSSSPAQLTASGHVLPATWNVGAASWVGSTGLVGLLGTWDVPKATLAVSPVADRVGLTSTATTTPIAFVTIPPHQGAHGFDDDTLTVATWGQSINFYGGKTGSDPRCETGGCAAMGPWPYAICSTPQIGFAGRIESATVATSIAVRYRVLLKSQSFVGLFGPAVYVDVASPNVAIMTSQIQTAQGDFQPLATPIDGMQYATGWTTLTAQAPAPSKTLGFTIRAAALGCGGPAPGPVDVELLVDSVSAQ